MSRLFSLIVQFCTIVVASLIIGGKIWGDLWMYHGWPGPPNVLATILCADGENAYDAATNEMSIICFIVLSAVWYGLTLKMRSKKA